MRFLLAALLLTGLMTAGCGGGGEDATDHNAAAIEAAEEGGHDAKEAEVEVMSVLRPKLHIHPYSGVDDAFQLPDGLWCSISSVQPASHYLYGIPDDDLISPDGETVVRVGHFIDPNGTPEETVMAECLEATRKALDW